MAGAAWVRTSVSGAGALPGCLEELSGAEDDGADESGLERPLVLGPVLVGGEGEPSGGALLALEEPLGPFDEGAAVSASLRRLSPVKSGAVSA